MGKRAKARAPFLPRRPRKNIIDEGGTNPPSAALKGMRCSDNDKLCLLIS